MALNPIKKHTPHLTQQAHNLIQTHFERYTMRPKLAIDATCGNGNDTLFLAALAERVFAFDIQEIALAKTRTRLIESQLLNKVCLFHAGHENLKKYVEEDIDCIMFNLGYLPKADKTITTIMQTSLMALNASLDLLNKDFGLLSLLCYPGHPEGRIELDAITQWLGDLPNTWSYQKYLSNYPTEKAPILFHITHKKTSA